MRFPHYHRANAFIFLDDDASYLDTLASILPKEWPIRLFTNANQCLSYIQAQNTAWDTDMQAHQTLINGWRSNGSLIPPILEYWRSSELRYGLTNICVVDFSMPAMNGLNFLQLLPGWLSHRVLLTGKADEHIAVDAFNDGLIDRFIPKQTQQIGRHLVKLLTGLVNQPMAFYDGIWSSALKQDQYAILQESTVSHALKEIVEEKQWVEYFVIPQPFGILALDHFARVHWLQLELMKDLPALADLAQSTGESLEIVESIREGKQLLNAELLQALESDDKPSVRPSFRVGSSNNVLGAHFRIFANTTYGISYKQYVSNMPAQTSLD
jgi:CheY-like chemotaxis protein